MFYQPAPLTVEEYVKMFTESHEMDGKRARLIEYHFSCDDYTTSATDMAKAMGYAGFEGANLQYATFAKNLLLSMRWYKRVIPNKEYFAVTALALIYIPDGEKRKYYEWEL